MVERGGRPGGVGEGEVLGRGEVMGCFKDGRCEGIRERGAVGGIRERGGIGERGSVGL